MVKPKAPLAAVACYVVAILAAVIGAYLLLSAPGTAVPGLGAVTGLAMMGSGLLFWVVGRICTDVSAMADIAYASHIRRGGDVSGTEDATAGGPA